MSSMNEIKQRIENVTSTHQLIRAMNTIASTKLIKARNQMEGVRPMFSGLNLQVEEIASLEEAHSHPYYHEAEVDASLYIVFSSDQGYAGSYNANVLNFALNHMEKGKKNEQIIVIGNKGYQFFKRHNKRIIHLITDIKDSHVYYGSEELAQMTRDLYDQGQVQECFIIFTNFMNVLTYEPKVERILPIDVKHVASDFVNRRLYEPDLHTFIDELVPLYLHMAIFRAVSESHTSEQAARMTNMDTASNNASDLIKELSQQYNRQRQAAITQELSEIVGGANFE